jgi:hypothetical protein
MYIFKEKLIKRLIEIIKQLSYEKNDESQFKK